MKLTPLSPYQYNFDGVAGRSRNSYFVLEGMIGKAVASRAQMRVLLEDIGNAEARAFSSYSIYVYAMTGILNASYGGEADDLRGVHDADLRYYARWDEGQLNVLYQLTDGKVDFDLIRDSRIAVPWEFD